MPKREPLRAEDHLHAAEDALHRAARHLQKMGELRESVRRLKSVEPSTPSSGRYAYVGIRDDRQEGEAK